MIKFKSLQDFIGFNSEFRNAINLYLNLNNRQKILSYIPTKSSVKILKKYIDAIKNNTLHASMLIGPYGKGKSHLLLIFLAILSADLSDKKEKETFDLLIEKIRKVDKETSELINEFRKEKISRFLPVIINCQSDVNQAFLFGLNDALKRNNLENLTPTTYFEKAVEVIKVWKMSYPNTFAEFNHILKEHKLTLKKMEVELLNYNSEYLELFKEIYPRLTSGSIFNPLVESEVTRLYSSIAEKLREEYNYRGIYIVFDEFSKFIEGQDKQASGINMKIIQDVCEMASDTKDPQIYINLIAHKPIKEYGKLLKKETINSFVGIQGRLDEEIIFKISAKNNYELIQNAIIKNIEDLTNLPENIYLRYFSRETISNNYAIPGFSEFTYEDFESIVVKGCYPLSPISTYSLLNISEKVAQNERTLFTYISKDEQKSLAEFVRRSNIKNEETWIATPDLIYDYFENLFKNESDDIQEIFKKSMSAINIAKTEYKENSLQIRILKSLATLMIIGKKQEMPWDEYTLCLALEMNYSSDSKERFRAAILQLKELDIIELDGENLFKFKTIEGIELETEISKRWKVAINDSKVNTILKDIYDKKYVFPKKYNYEYCITRYFRMDFCEVQEFLEINSDEVFFCDGIFCDGKILCLYQFDDGTYDKKIQQKVKELSSHRIIVLYTGREIGIKDDISKYQVVQDIKSDFLFMQKNPRLESELKLVEEGLEQKILDTIESLFGRFGNYDSYLFVDNDIYCSKQMSMSEMVDKMCYAYWSETPIINSELINKQNVSTVSTKTARKNIMERLLHNKSVQDYVKGTSQESTLFRALFVNNGVLNNEMKSSIKSVMEHINQYMDLCVDNRVKFSNLINIITKEPYGVRLGVIPVYLAYMIGKRHVDTVIYYGEKEIPLNTDTIISMCDSPDEYSLFLSADDEKREKYLKDLCDLFLVNLKQSNKESRISQIFEGMQRWYRGLPQISKNLKKSDDYFEHEYANKALSRISNLLQRYEVNSYEAVFVQIPEVLNARNDFDKCIKHFKYFKTRLSAYYYEILDETTEKTKEVFNAKGDSLYHAITEWYKKQSDKAKGNISEQKIESFMRTVEEFGNSGLNSTFDDKEITNCIVKAISGVYIASWNSESLKEYIKELEDVKNHIELIEDECEESGNKLVYTSRVGKNIYYQRTDNEDVKMFKDILSSTIEDFEGLGKNDLISVLLDEVEKIISK